MDREADVFALFAEQRRLSTVDALVRANYNWTRSTAPASASPSGTRASLGSGATAPAFAASRPPSVIWRWMGQE